MYSEPAISFHIPNLARELFIIGYILIDVKMMINERVLPTRVFSDVFLIIIFSTLVLS